jgi:methylthioribulose-1-phosphate dehydratase
MKQFYHLDWVTGTGGGISIKLKDDIYIAPSGVHKERVQVLTTFISFSFS